MLNLPIKIPKEITDKYSIDNNTFIRVAKDDPKDRIEVEIGDIKQPDFLPQVKVKRWDNEVNFSVRLSDKEKGISKVSTLTDKITWSKGNIDIEYYNYTEGEGGHKMVWFLKEKPANTKDFKVEFTIQSKGLDFFYQPELTQEEIDEGHIRPENVVGSYAVYHQTKGGLNDIDGKEYKAGKFGHIYRPHLYDSNGLEAWGNLHIENGIYSVEIPQEFLDNAVYPIKSNDDFGYTGTTGTTSWNVANWGAFGIGNPGKTGTVSKISIWRPASENSSNNDDFKGIIWKVSDSSILANAITPATDMPYGGGVWVDGTFAVSPSVINENYYVGVVSEGSTKWTWLYDTASAGDGGYDEGNSFTSPTSISDHTDNTKRFSIYATYTPSGGETIIGPFPTHFRI